LFFCFGCLFFQ
jgi:hypothetical protein